MKALLFLAAAIAIAGSADARSSRQEAIAKKIRAEVASLVAGINAHDPDKATAYDAPDIIAQESGSPTMHGKDADRAGFKMAFGYAPSWRVSLVEDSVDVAAAGDMAIYRGSYNEDSVDKGVPRTHVTRLIAEFRRQPDGAWLMPWYVVSPTGPSHPK